MRRSTGSLTLAVLVVVNAVRGEETFRDDPVRNAATITVKDVYGDVDTDAIRRYPIGVFDSGTGGLTVLERILTLDAFDNQTRRSSSEGDGKLDFANESFIFLADQANMPYGNYPTLGKEKLLDDLIVKDAWFLMGRKSFRFTGPNNQLVQQNKLPVKAIVIACNTATAYGQDDIEQVIKRAGLDIKVIGVIDAGAKGAVGAFQDGTSGTIGVVPTKGTVLSGAYPRAIRENAKDNSLAQRIDIFQQGALGLAGSIDGAQEFILLNAESSAAREDYRGPSLTNPEARIERRILPRYDFDYSDNHILYSGSLDNPTELQLNSVDNYIAYHLVTLLERIRAAHDSPPLRVIVLGCTHFPFYKDCFRRELDRLRNYQEDGHFIYRRYMAERTELIDPAYFAARELYQTLAADERVRDHGDVSGTPRGEFYLTIPCREKPSVKLNEAGWFTYEHKYTRNAGRVASDFRAVPLDGSNVGRNVLDRLQRQVPAVWELLSKFPNRTEQARPASTQIP
jgi:glutamate racemase